MPHATPIPGEYLTLYLCRDVFHCTPPMLREMDYADIRDALNCMAAEQAHEHERRGRG